LALQEQELMMEMVDETVDEMQELVHEMADHHRRCTMLKASVYSFK
jgi:hypothetical protein